MDAHPGFSATHLNIGVGLLANRSEFHTNVADAVAITGTHDSAAVIFFDLDRFSTINAVFGHEFGYKALEIVAQRLLHAFPSALAVAHMGNDEFAVLLGNEKPAQLRVLGQRALRSIRDTIFIDDQELLLTASAGISDYPARARCAEDLTQQAAIAVAEAKQTGGNTCSFYSATAQRLLLSRLNLELDLRKALTNDEIEVFYQPKFDLTIGKITALEALARWRHPQLGWISPRKFIPIAEEAGMISEIGEFVLLTACERGKSWLVGAAKYGVDRISVNLSAQQIQNKNLVKSIERILRRSGFPAEHLILEITENMFIDAQSMTILRLNRLRELGIHVAIDDFGTGYSSLSLLKRFPADILKIDRQFIRDVTENHVDATITRAVIDIAHSLSLLVVAEGVENEKHVQFLQDSNCDSIQGFFISRAVAAPKVPKLLASNYLQKPLTSHRPALYMESN
ncbi:MAG: putative bifunctional diguanylate cyclase/phosphodiesterase [Pseudomonadales bacterium]